MGAYRKKGVVMPNIGLCVVEKVFEGEAFSNTYALQNGDFNSAPLNNADLTAFVGTATAGFGGDETNPEIGEYLGETSALACILGFDRLMTSGNVAYTRLYVSDGKTPGVPTGAFATFPLSFFGLAMPGAGPETIAPLNIALQINRLPASFSQRAGRIQFRAALVRTELEPFGRDGVTLSTAGQLAALGRFQNAYDTSFIFPELLDPTNYSIAPRLVIPKYAPVGDPNEGAIVASGGCGGFSLGDAVGRQVQRGRRRSPAP